MHLKNFITKKVEVDMTLDTSAFASGDIMGTATIPIPTVMFEQSPKVRLWIEHITILDKDDQGGLFDLVVLDANKSLGTLNAAPSISDADAAAIVAVIPVTSWTDVGGAQIARPSFDPVFVELADLNLYLAAISRDTKTYSAAGLRLKLGVRIESGEGI
ncbi:MAG TPA: hypothetical protein VG838_00525 [Opitutaceae bacterium]|nr:hypothetical protein [Opitutaceae bacterium]